MLEEQVDRTIQLASKIQERLDSNEPLSTLLSQIRLLAEMCNDSFTAARADIAIHGLLHVPEMDQCRLDPIFVQAALSHTEFCHTEDPREISVEKTLKDFREGKAPSMDWSYVGSVFELENMEPPLKPWAGMSGKNYDTLLQSKTMHKERRLLLTRMRAYFYEYASKKLLEALREKDRLTLLGPDYNLVLSSLGTLDTVVGEELEAAIDRLSSSKAAGWSLCALGCRNVVIKLGRLLWKAPGDVYFSKFLGKELDLSGEKEKNKLQAYVDYHWQRAESEERGMLEEAHKLVPKIWDIGSKGKTAKVRLNDAKALVVDTFCLVDLLDKTTGLVPVSALD